VILRFPYLPDYRTPLRQTPSRPPGQSYILRPLVPVRVVGPTGSAANLNEVLVDSGSVDTVFPAGIASWIGAQFIAAPPNVDWAVRWRGVRYALQFARVEIELTDHAGASLRWPAIVAFSAAPIPYDGLLGNLGCLSILNATFRGSDEVLELEPNDAFPGIVTAP
jgi:hypothetical protein